VINDYVSDFTVTTGKSGDEHFVVLLDGDDDPVAFLYPHVAVALANRILATATG
jgi:hypothetical protein